MTSDWLNDPCAAPPARHGRPRRGHSGFMKNGRPADLQPLPTLEPLAWNGAPIPERRWLVPGLIPEGTVTMLGGDGGLGKSLLAMQFLAAAALGKPWLGRGVRPCKAIGVFCEDDRDELHRRLVLLSQKVAACSGILGLALRILCERAYPGCMRGDDGPFAQ
jgi:RecA-family ATPase